MDDLTNEVRDLLNDELGPSRARVVYDNETSSRYIDDLDSSSESFTAPVCLSLMDVYV